MISQKLSETLDKLRDAAFEVERLFNEQRFNVEAFVQLNNENEPIHWLGWGRLLGHTEWRLLVRTSQFDELILRPLKDAPVDVRLAASSKFDELHTALIDAAMAREDFAEQQLAVATRFIENMKNSKVTDE